MKSKILSLKEKISLYEVALDIGVSESTLYNYVNDYKKISKKSRDKIRMYFKRREENENYANQTNRNFIQDSKEC
jgi:DNA-binding LacI/PurR family transcriptional regulator